jgi:hypothetical protein
MVGEVAVEHKGSESSSIQVFEARTIDRESVRVSREAQAIQMFAQTAPRAVKFDRVT